MAGISSRRNRTRCTLCSTPLIHPQCLVQVRKTDGVWRILYRLCWECGWAELQYLRGTFPDSETVPHVVGELVQA